MKPHHSTRSRGGIRTCTSALTRRALHRYIAKAAVVQPSRNHEKYNHVELLCYPPPPCNSYGKVPNQYGPCAYCSLDRAVPCAYHMHGERVQERGRKCTGIPKISAMWVQVGKHSQQMCP